MGKLESSSSGSHSSVPARCSQRHCLKSLRWRSYVLQECSRLINTKGIWARHQGHLLQKLTTILCESMVLLGSLHWLSILALKIRLFSALQLVCEEVKQLGVGKGKWREVGVEKATPHAHR